MSRVLAVLTVRNEGAFLIDWLAHARAVGFSDVLVFSNDCDDGTGAMLDRLAALGWLTHVRNDGPHEEGPQWAALKAATRHPLRRAADWVMVTDIDEFLTVQVGDGTIPDLLAAVPEADAIALTWRMFGNAGAVEYQDRPVTAQFLRAAPCVLHWPWRAQMIKTLFRNDGAYGKLGVHRPGKPDPARAPVWVDGAGRRLPPAFATGRLFTDPGSDPYALAQLNHYALGAMESFVVKADRGRANRAATTFDAGYWIERNFDAVEDRSALALDPRVAPLRESLRADPVLGPLHAAAVAWRRDRFEALMADERWRALLGQVMLAGPTRLLSPDEARSIWRHAQGG